MPYSIWQESEHFSLLSRSRDFEGGFGVFFALLIFGEALRGEVTSFSDQRR